MSNPLHRRLVPSGTTIFSEGDSGDCAYVIDRGAVEISTQYTGEPVILGVMGPGSILGEMAIIDDEPRSATALALEDTELTVITRDQVRSRLGDADPVIALLLQVTLDRYRSELRRFQGIDDEDADPKTYGATLVEGDAGLFASQSMAIDKFKLEGELRLALERREFELYFQPILAISGQQVAGFEALIRWIHPERGFIPPDKFIGIAEETQLIVPIGTWVMEESCRRLLEFQAMADRTQPDLPPLFMSINVSGRQFSQPDFIDILRRVVRETGVDPTRLKLEITESLLMNYKEAQEWLTAARDLGPTIALDDFGTGYSSLSYLLHFPIDTLKIDRAFIQHMHEDPRSASLVKAIIDMTRTLELDVVAEGIEEEPQLAQLGEMNCKYAQGYYFSRPVPVAAALEYLQS